jgi:hypothetical protein
MSRITPKRTPQPEALASLIYLLRGEKVMLSEHLAELYAGLSKSSIKRSGATSIAFPMISCSSLLWPKRRPSSVQGHKL